MSNECNCEWDGMGWDRIGSVRGGVAKQNKTVASSEVDDEGYHSESNGVDKTACQGYWGHGRSTCLTD